MDQIFSSEQTGNHYRLAKCQLQFKEMYGPIFWNFLHSTAMANNSILIEHVMLDVLKLMDRIMVLFPCKACIGAYNTYLTLRRPAVNYLATYFNFEVIPNYDLFTWTVEMHNLSNSKLHKREISFVEAFDMYKSHCTCLVV